MGEEMEHKTELIKTTVDELLKVLATDNVIGETMEIDDKVIIPITKVGLAFGTGSGMGSMGNRKAGAHGAGGGAGIEPLSVIVAYKGIKGPEGINIMSVQGMGPLSKMAADLGHAFQKMMEKEGGPEGMMKKGMEMKEKMQGGGSGGSKESMPRGPGSEPRM